MLFFCSFRQNEFDMSKISDNLLIDIYGFTALVHDCIDICYGGILQWNTCSFHYRKNLDAEFNQRCVLAETHVNKNLYLRFVIIKISVLHKQKNQLHPLQQYSNYSLTTQKVILHRTKIADIYKVLWNRICASQIINHCLFSCLLCVSMKLYWGNKK